MSYAAIGPSTKCFAPGPTSAPDFLSAAGIMPITVMMSKRGEIELYGKLTAANYLVNTYIDLKEVVETIEGMIEAGTNARDQAIVRKLCKISVIPLNTEENGHILRILIPEQVFGKKPAATKEKQDSKS